MQLYLYNVYWATNKQYYHVTKKNQLKFVNLKLLSILQLKLQVNQK